MSNAYLIGNVVEAERHNVQAQAAAIGAADDAVAGLRTGEDATTAQANIVDKAEALVPTFIAIALETQETHHQAHVVYEATGLTEAANVMSLADSVITTANEGKARAEKAKQKVEDAQAALKEALEEFQSMEHEADAVATTAGSIQENLLQLAQRLSN